LKDYKNLDKNIIENFENHKFDYKKYFSEYSSYSIYNDKTENIISLFNDEQIKELKDKYGEMISFKESYAPIVKESEYNKLMELYDKENLKVNLKDNEYLLTSDFDELIKYYDEILNENKPIVINNKTYIPQNDKCINIGLGNTNMSYNAGIFIVPDEAVIGTNKVYNYVCANYIGDKEKTEELFNNAIKNFYSKSNVAPPFSASISKIEVEASSIGMSVMITFIGLYLGIIFCITCAAILAIQQLSEASDNKQRYTILRKIGTDEKMINRSLFTQIGIFFMFPLSIAIIHALVGLNELNSIVKMFGKIDISKNAFITAGFIILVYGGYFIATYIESKNIIKEKDR
ncbi:MAG: ABC transporter permease, partial [Clostridia bacterium]